MIRMKWIEEDCHLIETLIKMYFQLKCYAMAEAQGRGHTPHGMEVLISVIGTSNEMIEYCEEQAKDLVEQEAERLGLTL